jgi:hypothetical protein
MAPSPHPLGEALERWRIPMLMALVILLYAGTRFDSTRPLEARAIALGIPALAAIMGAAPLWDSHPVLRAAAFAVAIATLVMAELSLWPAMVSSHPVVDASVLWVAMPLLTALAVVVEGVAARRGLRSRIAAWVGLTAGLAIYLPGHVIPEDLLGSVVAGLLVAMATGGIAGLLLGAAAVRVGRSLRDG